jgi:hypothetical protein
MSVRASQLRRQPLADADVGRDLSDRLGALADQLDGPTAELRRMRRWRGDSSSEVLPPQRRCPVNRGMLTSMVMHVNRSMPS